MAGCGWGLAGLPVAGVMLIWTPELLILPTKAEPELTEAQVNGWPGIGSSGHDALPAVLLHARERLSDLAPYFLCHQAALGPRLVLLGSVPVRTGGVD